MCTGRFRFAVFCCRIAFISYQLLPAEKRQQNDKLSLFSTFKARPGPRPFPSTEKYGNASWF